MQTNDRRLKKGFKEKMRKMRIHHVHPLLNVLRGIIDQIIDLCQEFKKLPKESNAVIINLLQGNDCKPVTVKKIEGHFAKHVVNDHDYVPGKHKRYATHMEEEASECELNQFFKQDLICCSEGNECEPLDINFSSDIVISHSVIISNLPEPAMETGMAVETGIAMINEENLEVAQSLTELPR